MKGCKFGEYDEDEEDNGDFAEKMEKINEKYQGGQSSKSSGAWLMRCNDDQSVATYLQILREKKMGAIQDSANDLTMSDKAHEDSSLRDVLTNMDGIGSNTLNNKGEEVKDTQEGVTDVDTGAVGITLNIPREERRSERLMKEIATITDEKNRNMAKK